MIDLRCGDCREIAPTLGPVDAIVTDPPYELAFMGKRWDSTGVAFQPETWAAIGKALKPGGYLLAFGGTRTYHRLVCAIEDGGFEIRDCLNWLYGQGFPKGKSCLKPAWEPIVLARKPGPKVLPLQIDACRIEIDGPIDPKRGGYRTPGNGKVGSGGVYEGGYSGRYDGAEQPHPDSPRHDARGRWPANVMHDGSEDAVTGMPAVFFYCSKASRADRNEGLDGMPERSCDLFGDDPYTIHRNGDGRPTNGDGTVTPQANHHPTVKPTDLMRWLCRLVTPPGGTILDPFMGSGSTGKAAMREGFQFIGIEREPEYLEIARRRIGAEQAKTPLLATSR